MATASCRSSCEGTLRICFSCSQQELVHNAVAAEDPQGTLTAVLCYMIPTSAESRCVYMLIKGVI